MGANDSPRGVASLDPRIYVDWQDLCRGQLTLLHTKYVSCGPHGFREEDFLSFSHYKSMGANDPHPERGQFGPQMLNW